MVSDFSVFVPALSYETTFIKFAPPSSSMLPLNLPSGPVWRIFSATFVVITIVAFSVEVPSISNLFVFTTRLFSGEVITSGPESFFSSGFSSICVLFGVWVASVFFWGRKALFALHIPKAIASPMVAPSRIANSTSFLICGKHITVRKVCQRSSGFPWTPILSVW